MPSLCVNLPRGLGTNLIGLSIAAQHQADQEQGQLTMFLHEVSGYSMNPIFHLQELDHQLGIRIEGTVKKKKRI